jgi:DNA-binding NarL/FixJ family response regulator
MPLTILVADDDVGTRVFISDYLELSGYLAIAAENGEQALRMVDEYHPHLLITDITMPQMDGYELVRQVRRKPAFRLLPVVFLTARTNTEERIRGYQSGGDVYLPKPFEIEELGAVIRNLLERSQMIQTEWRIRTQPQGLTTGDPGSVAIAEEPVAVAPHFSGTPPRPFVELTSREKDVLDLLTEGLSNAQIGDSLHLSSRTVEKYVSSLLRKTETSNRAELVRFAMEHQLVK